MLSNFSSMGDQKDHPLSATEKEKRGTKSNFQESAQGIREEAGRMALAADARGNSVTDILSGMEGDEISEKKESGAQRKSDPVRQSSSSAQQDDAGGGSAAVGGLGQISFPEPRIMVRKIKTAVKTEIKSIEKSVKKLQKTPIKNAKALTDAVALLRKMRIFLMEVVYKTVEALKSLWMEITAGRKISELV